MSLVDPSTSKKSVSKKDKPTGGVKLKKSIAKKTKPKDTIIESNGESSPDKRAFGFTILFLNLQQTRHQDRRYHSKYLSGISRCQWYGTESWR